MPTTIPCAGCGSTFYVSDALLGKKIRCQSCMHVIQVSAQSDVMDVPEARQLPRRRRPLVDDDDEDELPFRRRHSRDKQSMMLALIVGGIVAGVLVLGLGFAGIWWILNKAGRANATDTESAAPPALAANPAPPVQSNAPPLFAGNPAPPAAPQPRRHLDGAQTVQLSNARVSGFGAQMQIEVDYRFHTGVAGANVYLMVKPTRFGFRQNLYEVHLNRAIGTSQGTVVASGMTFGIENGPFEVWMEE